MVVILLELLMLLQGTTNLRPQADLFDFFFCDDLLRISHRCPVNSSFSEVF